MIGAIGGEADANAAKGCAARLLALEPIDLAHGALFTGKADTRIHADDAFVLKYRLDRKFDTADIAAQWARKRLQAEREKGVFHPRRIWLALPAPEGRGVLVGNLSPRLAPLHAIDWREHESPERILGEVARLYYQHLAKAGERLDEGLSNFALDDAGRVFYLDDDFYPWDEHHAFAAMVAQWLRTFSRDWLDETRAEALGALIGEALRPLPRIDADLFAQALSDTFLGDAASARCQHLLQGFHLALNARAAIAPAEEKTVEPDWRRPVGLIADIHANPAALEAVEREFEASGVRQFFCLGDIVGYGPDPAACIAWMRKRRVLTIRGNHDHYVAHGQGKVAMSQTARAAADWTRNILSDDEQAWLASLPLKYQNDDLLAVHGAPVDKSYFNGYVYETTWERNLAWMLEHGVCTCLHGHSHLQGGWIVRANGKRASFESPGMHLLAEQANLLNPGAIGQPRNRRPGAQAAILDLANHAIELLHVDYDMHPTIAGIRAAGLPESLIDRLLEGR